MIVATYNVHRCVGLDRRQDVERIAAVIRELGADVVGLQEVASGGEGDQLSRLAALTDLRPVAGPLLRRADARYGNALLLREAATNVRLIDLSVGRREPRGAIIADSTFHGRPLRVVVTHLGLGGLERRRQLQALLDGIAPGNDPAVILADLNDWLAAARTLPRVRSFGGRAVRSFPASWPVLALDRVLGRPPELLASVFAHVSPLSRLASDHLPVWGQLTTAGTDGAACEPALPRLVRRRL